MATHRLLRRRTAALLALLAALLLAGPARAHPGHEHEAEAAAGRAIAATPNTAPRETLDGVLNLLHSDDFDRGRAAFLYALERRGGFLRLDVSRVSSAPALVGKRVRVTGRRQNGAFVAEEVRVAATTRSLAAVAAGDRRVAVILVNFTNDTSKPWTADGVRSVVFGSSSSVNAYYRETSYGLTTFFGDVLGWFAIPYDNSGCKYSDWSKAGRTAATNAGADLTLYQHVVVAFPRASSCSWSGMASLGGSSSWINGSMTVRTVGHELGHNVGAHHASSYSCTEGGVRVTLSASCTASEYGDPFSIMGASTRQQHNWHRAQIGWLSDIQTVTSTGTYTVAPVEFAATPRLLRVARGDGKYFYLELRQPAASYDGFGTSDPAVTGVSIRLAPDLSVRTQSLLLDTTPSTTSFGDAPLPAGKTFTDSVSGVSITAVSVAPSGATVRIVFGGSEPTPPSEPDGQAPTTPGSFAATSTGATTVALSWIASTDNVGVAGYRVYRGGTIVTTTTATSFNDSGLSPQTTYGYSVVAFDAAGNVSPSGSASATTPAPDATAPSAPSNLKATAQRGKRVALSWTASTDDVDVVGYRVYRNGTLVGTTTSASYTDSLPGKTTSATYVVRAFDAAGNVSTPSNSASI